MEYQIEEIKTAIAFILYNPFTIGTVVIFQVAEMINYFQ